MMEGDKITIYMQCLNWTCGEEAYFDIMLTKGAAVHVSWGDNHCVENPRVRDPRDRLRLTLFAEIGLSIGTDIKMTPVRELSGRGFFL